MVTPLLVVLIAIGSIDLLFALDSIPAVFGVKLILHWAHVDIDERVPEIPTPLSLAVIVAVLAVVTVASLVRTRNDPSAKAHPGSPRAHRPGDRDQPPE
jgi:tellurite resistance protein TerC